tara:strand:+ start:419 stop:637 length:219 start_codon:yes stop_codon:yes gene_type:complete
MRSKFTSILITLIPGSVFPCAVCYWNPESPMSHGMNMGVLTLLGFISFVLLIIAYSIITLSIRTKKTIFNKE